MSDVLKIIKEQKSRKKKEIAALQQSYNKHPERKKRKKKKTTTKPLNDKDTVTGLRRKISNWKQSQEKLPPIPKTKTGMEVYIDRYNINDSYYHSRDFKSRLNRKLSERGVAFRF